MIRTGVRVTGTAELQRALKRVEASLDGELRDTDIYVAEHLAAEAKAAAYSIGGVAAHVAPSIKAIDGIVNLGGTAWPMAPGAERGSDTYRQFQPYTGPTNGYFLFPTVVDSESFIDSEYDRAVTETLRKANAT